MTSKDNRHKKQIKRKNIREEKKRQAILRFEEQNPILAKLISYFKIIFRKETDPTRKNLILMMMAMLYKDACPSVRSMFHSFIRKHTKNQLTALYYTLNHSQLFPDEWNLNLLSIILTCSEVVKYLPIFYIFDDTLVEKKGEHFELRATLFDHNSKNGSSYLNGHCFVSLVIAIPVRYRGTLRYLKVPLIHKMWDKESGVTKLQMARDMVLSIDSHLGYSFLTAVLCDSWYPKGEVLELHTLHQIPFVCAVRSDTALYDLPDSQPEGKRGRKPIRGKKLSKNLGQTFNFIDIDDYPYQIGSRQVMTDIFHKTICQAYATKSVAEQEEDDEAEASVNSTDEQSQTSASNSTSIQPENEETASDGSTQVSSVRKKKQNINLFLATEALDLSDFSVDMLGSEETKTLVRSNKLYISFAIYQYRWTIENTYYELKLFWNFGGYKLRSKIGVESLINIQNILYALMSVLPYISNQFAVLADLSAQERRFKIGEFLRKVEFMDGFVQHIETTENSQALRAVCAYYMENHILL